MFLTDNLCQIDFQRIILRVHIFIWLFLKIHVTKFHGSSALFDDKAEAASLPN